MSFDWAMKMRPFVPEVTHTKPYLAATMYDLTAGRNAEDVQAVITMTQLIDYVRKTPGMVTSVSELEHDRAAIVVRIVGAGNE